MVIIGHYDLFGSLNNICIQGKQQWWGVEFTDHRKLEQLFRNKQCEPYTRGRTYPIVDEVLLRNGIQVQGGMQSAGDCMIIPATIYHWGHAEVSGDTDILVSSLHLWLSSHLLWFPLHHAVNRSEGICEGIAETTAPPWNSLQDVLSMAVYLEKYENLWVPMDYLILRAWKCNALPMPPTLSEEAAKAILVCMHKRMKQLEEEWNIIQVSNTFDQQQHLLACCLCR